VSSVPFTTGPTPLQNEAAGAAEGLWTSIGLKIPEDNPNGAKLAALHSLVYARLLAQNPGVNHATLMAAADYGISVAERDYGTTAGDVPESPIATVGQTVTTEADAAKKTAQASTAALEAVGTFVQELGDKTTWLRALYIVSGAVAVSSGIFIIAKELGANAPVAPVVTGAKFVAGKTPIGRAANAAKGKT